MAAFLSLEMTLTREEFLRLLPALETTVPNEGQVFAGGEGAKSWRLTLVPLPERRVGALLLPRCRVDLRFEGHTPAEIDAFMTRFQRAFQRGGG